MHDTVLTVSAVNTQVKQLLEHIGPIQVTGEISACQQPTSGHLYFTLKDHQAQLRCVFFRMYQKNITLKQGMQIIAKGKLSLYELRGDYQFIVYHVEEAGIGMLYQQFEALKKKLSLAGLFDVQHKKPLPPFPKTIGLITSPHSAACRDLLITLYQRYPLAQYIIYPTEVQGHQAVAQIIMAIKKACLEKQTDVLILSRGGGSIEDLWAFNDEKLAYTLYEASIPIITGIGHETDFTIADFVADYRAATPTAAIVAATPDYRHLLQQLSYDTSRLLYLLNRHFTTPAQTIDQLSQTLHHILSTQLHQKMQSYTTIHQRLMLLPLQQTLIVYQSKHKNTLFQLIHAIKNHITTTQQTCMLIIQMLNTLNPLETLNRGYAIVSQHKKILINSHDVKPQDLIDIRLAQGQLQAKIIL